MRNAYFSCNQQNQGLGWGVILWQGLVWYKGAKEVPILSESNFTLIFRGPAVDDGEIDVRDLAPALLAIGDVLQAANQTINQDRAKVSVKVRATAKGCFEVDLSLWQDVVGTVLTFAKVHQPDIAAANELADLVLKVGGAGGVGGGLFWLLMNLKGRKPDKVESKGAHVHIHVGDNVFVTSKQVVDLAESVEIRENAKKFVTAIGEGIESVSARQDGGKELAIGRSDVTAFDLPNEEDEELSDTLRQMVLQIISLSFKEDNKWRLSNGLEQFNASIEDEDFLKKIANNEISFGKNDYLTCEVRERQIKSSGGLKMERTITRVVKHEPAARQMKLL